MVEFVDLGRKPIRNDFPFAKENLSRFAVDRNPVSFAHLLIPKPRYAPLTVDDERGAAHDTDLPKLAGNNRGMRRSAAKRRQNAGRERKSCNVFRRGLRANEDDIAKLSEFGCWALSKATRPLATPGEAPFSRATGSASSLKRVTAAASRSTSLTREMPSLSLMIPSFKRSIRMRSAARGVRLPLRVCRKYS